MTKRHRTTNKEPSQAWECQDCGAFNFMASRRCESCYQPRDGSEQVCETFRFNKVRFHSVQDKDND